MDYLLDDGVLQEQLEAYIAKLQDDATVWTLHLYTNNHAPTLGDDVTDYTEATFSGATGQDIDPDDWGSVTVSSNIARSESATPLTFTKGDAGSVTVYGYYLTLTDNTTFRGSEIFASPKTLTMGDSVTITPRIGQRNRQD